MSYPPVDGDIPTNFSNTTVNFNTHPEAHNNTNIAIRSIRDALGAAPQGSKATVQARLESLEAQINLAILSGGSGGPPSGEAGGDLTGTYPNPTIGSGVVDSVHISASIKDAAAGVQSLRSLGTNANQALPGNHPTTNNSRTPTGAAGGHLDGTYPNPTIAAGAVGTTQLAANSITDEKMAVVPWLPGDLKWTAASQLPSGWLLCDGSAVSRSTYSALFAAIGTTYGTGDGTSTFNLPNARSRTLVAAGTASGGLTARALGASGGAETVTLTALQMPQHNHTATSTSTVSDPGHNHRISVELGSQSSNKEYTPVNYAGGTLITTSSSQTGISVSTATSITNAGSGNAHENMMPYLVGNLFIKT